MKKSDLKASIKEEIIEMLKEATPEEVDAAILKLREIDILRN